MAHHNNNLRLWWNETNQNMLKTY